MKKYLMSLCTVIGIFSAVGISNATLWDRGNGMIYDDAFDITWLQDANFAYTSGYDTDGRMTWAEATTWADQLIFGGYDDWRLPTALNPDGTGPDGWHNDAYNKNTSEMGHLFYDELGGIAGASIYDSSDPDLAMFMNIQGDLWTNPDGTFGGSDPYWTSTYLPSWDRYWYFAFSNGSQWARWPNSEIFTWAVRDGDVTAAPVPEPATMLLLGGGLLGFAGFRKKSKKVDIQWIYRDVSPSSMSTGIFDPINHLKTPSQYH